MATDHNFKVKKGLDVLDGDINLKGTGNLDVYLGTSGSTEAAYISRYNNDFYLMNKDSGDLIFGTNNENKGRFTSTGNFQVGTTTVIDSNRNLTNIGTISSGSITSSGNITAGSGSGFITAGTTSGYVYAKSLRLANAETTDTDFQFAYQMIVDANDVDSDVPSHGNTAGSGPFGVYFLGDNGATTKTLGSGLVKLWHTGHFTKAHIDHFVGLQGGTQDLTAPNISVTGNLDIAQFIRHTGDTNTAIGFFSDEISLRTGGTERINITNSDVKFTNTQVFFDSTMGIGASTYAPIEGATDAERNWLNFHRSNDASYVEITNRTPAGKVVLSGGLDGGGGEVQRLEIEGGSSTKSVKILASTDLDLSSSSNFKMGGLNVITSGRNIQNIGNVNIGGYYAMDGTTIIDTSKNLVNIGTISSGVITATGEGHTFYNSSNSIKFGRNGNENIQIIVTDGSNKIVATQDSDADGDHDFILDRVFNSSTGASNFYIRNAGSNQLSIDKNANVTIAGNLTVQGTTTTINTANLNVEDKNITLNYGTSDTSSSADGAGITIQDAVSASTDATLTWDATNDKFDFSHPVLINRTTSGGVLHLKNSFNGGHRYDLLIENTNDRDAGLTLKTTGGQYEMWIDSNGDDSLIFSAGDNTTDITMELYQNKNVDIGGNLQVTGEIDTSKGLTFNPNGYDINGDSDGNRTLFTFTRSGSASWQIWHTANQDLNFVPNNTAYKLQWNGNDLLYDSGNISVGTIASGAITANSAGTNVVATFTSTDSIAAIKLEDSNGNVELSAAGETFRVQPDGGDPVLSVTANGTAVLAAPTSGASLTLRREDVSTSGVFLVGSSFSYIGTTTNKPFHIYQNNATALEFDTSKNATFAGNIRLTKEGTADTDNQSYNSRDLEFLASGWDTNNNAARDVMWKIRNVPTPSVYPDHDLQFIESDQGSDYVKFQLHGRGSTNHTDPLAATFFGNVSIEAGTGGTNAGEGDLTVAGQIDVLDGTAEFVISGDSSGHNYLKSSGEIRIRPDGTTINKLVIGSNGNITTAGYISASEQSVFTGNSISGTPNTNAQLVAADSGVAGIAIQTNDGGSSYVWFGDTTDNAVGRIRYDHSSDEFTFRAGATDNVFEIDSSGMGKLFELTLKGGSDNLTFTETGGDWSIKNAQQNNGIVICDGSGGVEIHYNNAAVAEFDSLGGMNIVSGALTMGGTTRIGAGGAGTFSDLTLSDGSPALTLSDTSNGGGGGAFGVIKFTNTEGDAIAIGYTADDATGSDLYISTNAAGTYGGYMGLDAAGISDARADIVLEPKTDVRIATGGLKVGTSQFITSARALENVTAVQVGSLTQQNSYGRLQVNQSANNDESGIAILDSTNGRSMRLWADSTTSYINSGDGGSGNLIFNEAITVSSGGNLTGVGTISSGAITTSGRSTFDRFRVNSSETAESSSGINFTITDSVSNQNFTGVRIDHNASGSQAHTTDNGHYALFVDMDTSQTGGDTGNENRAYGIYSDVRGTGDTDLRYALFGYSETQHSAGTVSENAGILAQGVADETGTGRTTNNYGGKFFAYEYGTGTGGANNHYALYGKVLLTSAADKDTSSATGVYGEVEIDTSDTATTLSNAYVFQGQFDNDSSDTTISNGYLFYGNYSGTLPTTAYGVYIADTVDNYFGGYVRSATGFKISNIEVIDDQRNLTSIGTISSGAITSSSTVTWSGGSSTNANTAYGWGNHASAGYLTSVAFNDLTGKTSATGDYSTTGDIVAGRNSGSIALTINDGKGNSNIAFNHQNGVPDQNGNAARIEVNTDSSTGASMYFEVKSNVTGGTSVDLTPIFRANETGLYMESGKVIQMNGSTFVDTDRNITAGTISSGAITSTGASSFGDVAIGGAADSNYDLKVYGLARFQGAANFVDATDPIQVGGNTVIDSSRNLTNIGTISSGAITSSGNIGGTTLTASSYASVGSIVAADPGSSYYSYNNRIGSGLAVVGAFNNFGDTTISGTVTWSGGSSTNANTAYGWGDHSAEGYLTSADYDTHVCHLKTNVSAAVDQGVANEFTVNFNLEEHNDSTTFSHSSGVVTVATAGWYRVYANMVYQNAATSSRNTVRAYVEKNGTEVTSTATYDYDRGSTYGEFSNNKIETMLYLAANDTVGIGNYAENEDGTITIEAAECEFIVSSVSVQTTSTNADTVDGLHASSFIRSDATDSASGVISFTNGSNSTTTTNGAVRITGGLGVGYNIHSGGLVRCNSGFVVNTTTVIDADRDLRNVNAEGGSTGVRFRTGVWFVDTADQQRLQFVAGGSNYYKTDGNAGKHFFFDGNSSTEASADAFIDASGNGHFAGNVTAYSSSVSSDIRLKENIRPIESATETIKELNGVIFDWKKTERGTDQLGFIAQEVEEVLPSLVTEVQTLKDENTETHKTVNYAALVPMLVESIKEQSAQINAQQEQINQLTDMVNALKEKS